MPAKNANDARRANLAKAREAKLAKLKAKKEGKEEAQEEAKTQQSYTVETPADEYDYSYEYSEESEEIVVQPKVKAKPAPKKQKPPPTPSEEEEEEEEEEAPQAQQKKAPKQKNGQKSNEEIAELKALILGLSKPQKKRTQKARSNKTIVHINNPVEKAPKANREADNLKAYNFLKF